MPLQGCGRVSTCFYGHILCVWVHFYMCIVCFSVSFKYSDMIRHFSVNPCSCFPSFVRTWVCLFSTRMRTFLELEFSLAVLFQNLKSHISWNRKTEGTPKCCETRSVGKARVKILS